MKIKEIIEKLEEFAPISLAEEWDNVGLMAGSAEYECTGVLVALDLTMSAIEQAKKGGCNLIVTHHPFIFHAIKSVDFESAKGRAVRELAKNDITVYSMHTNLDKAEGGTNAMLATMLAGGGTLTGEGVRFDIEPMRLCDFARQVADVLCDDSVRIAGNPQKIVSKVYLVSGAGGSEYEIARECADVLVTGDLKHHDYIDCVEDDFAIIEYSHFASEIIMQNIVADVLSPLGIKIIKAEKVRPFRLLEEIKKL